MSEMRTVRGMRDLMGDEMVIKEYLMAEAVEVFRQFGYEPLDSPVMELWETLSAKGGEEVEAETFKFEDKGRREVGLRFDLTVPLARIVATSPHLGKPFKRYATGKAWRYDRPQAGRYREFSQADVDIVGSASPAADAEVVLVALEFLRRVLGKQYLVRINNRKVLKGMIEKAGIPERLAYEAFRAIDKLDKIGVDGVKQELNERGIGDSQSSFLLQAISIKGKGMKAIAEFADLVKDSKVGSVGVEELSFMAEIFDQCGATNQIEFDMSLARGLDYYTGPVFEITYLGKPRVGSIGGGGRYDGLIEKFGGPPTPATGISLGIDRLIDILAKRKTSEELEATLDVFVAPLAPPMVKHAVKLQANLVQEGLSCEVDLMERSLRKQLDRADSKKARLLVIVGERDMEKGEVSLRDMTTKKTEQVRIEEVVEKILKSL
ncbi:MAG: histidine--tRNA ligase [Candidatus Thorarchaeota archaeon]|nr:histidine--tRNA ligase [Candidatus Thorarchaeota archaeon]